MTGIERLRGLTEFWRANRLEEIVEQIEREHGCDSDAIENVRLIVGRVITDMERHVSGHEGMEDSPVARWARELREALGGNGSDPAEYVSMSACDLLPEEDRDAIAWVREHGGIESVKAQRRESMPRAAYERKKAGFLDHIAECETALGRRREIISELNHRASDLTRENAELRKRAMPDGMEWLLEAWPMFEDGEPVRFLDDFERYGDENGVSIVTMYQDGSFALNCRAYSKGERVNHPAPKVLDADGVEIRVGDTVWSTREPKSGTVVYAYPPGDDGQPSVKVGAFWHHASELTHRAPVLAGDGKPLREGETVYDIEDAKGYPHTVASIELGGLGHVNTTCEEPTPASVSIHPSRLTHERPVLDADGVPIKVGETVWHEDGTELRVLGFKHEEDGERIVSVKFMDGPTNWSEVRSLSLTHERPDSWERLEEDAEGIRRDIAMYLGDWSQSDFEEPGDSVQSRVIDLVRRAKALAERGA